MNGRKRTRAQLVEAVTYQPQSAYRYDVEITRVAELRKRVPAEHWKTPQRPDFHLIICVCKGTFAHSIDFEPVACDRGSVLLIRPGQVHVWDMHHAWNGWIVVFRPEFLQPRVGTRAVSTDSKQPNLDDFPSLLRLANPDYEAITESISRMRADSGSTGDVRGLRMLLRAELRTLIIRLGLHCQRCGDPGILSSASAQRFEQFRWAVNRNYARMHSVAGYAAMLGCTAKSLQRAALAIQNLPARTVIAQRIALEAKRLLVHGDLSVSRICEELGFSEPTNFVKFFRREAGMTPGRFRNSHIGN